MEFTLFIHNVCIIYIFLNQIEWILNNMYFIMVHLSLF